MMKDYIAILSTWDNPTPAGRAAAFISTGPSGGAGKVQIEFENIYHRLQLSVLEGYIRERWGPLAVRVTRILVELGNVDEKHFTKVGLLAPSEVRPIISELQTAGIIELREVPKGKDFAPSRTFYFWCAWINGSALPHN
jgi:DNA-directed RNA polymerase III subunit RPC3